MRSTTFFSRHEFSQEPARASHGVVVPVSREVDADAVRAAARDATPQIGRIGWWDVSVPWARDDVRAEARRERELTRPVAREEKAVRALLLRYVDGASDLVLVAHRATLDSSRLSSMATALAAGDVDSWASQAVASGHVAEQDGGQASGAPAPVTGLGDPQRAGRLSQLDFWPGQPGEDVPAESVAAALAITLARYGEQGDLALLVDGQDAPLRTLRVLDDETAAEVLQRAKAVEPADALDAAQDLPAFGVVYSDGDASTYRPSPGPVFPFTLHVWREEDVPRGRCLFDEGHVRADFAASLVRSVCRVLPQLGTARDRKVVEFALVDDDEARSIVRSGVRPAVKPLAGRNIHEPLAERAQQHPDRVACSGPDGTMTYAELESDASRMARGMRARGVRPGGKVGVCLDRGTELVAVLLAVLKTGAAYVPTDRHAPAERVRYTMEDAGVSLVVTDAPDFSHPGIPTCSPENLRDEVDPGLETVETQPGDAAYVIYTSGSTGRPKGVVIPHGNVLSLVAATRADMGLGKDDVWTMYHSPAFDLSVWEIWGCLLTGGRLVCVPHWVCRAPEDFHSLLVREGVTVLNQTPSAFAQLREYDATVAPTLKTRLVICGGETLDVASLRCWFRRYPATRCRVVNMFGITETTVHVTTRTVSAVDVAHGSKTVGPAMPGWSVSVRDAKGRPLPYGARGEIYVGGAGLATGYHDRPELTAERFLDDNYGEGRVYRSGDSGRMYPDGHLDHLGRMDHQVQLRGYRIELDEIKSVLLEDPEVSAAAVLVTTGPDGDAASARLDAYVAATGRSSREIKERISTFLPEYMVPSSVTVLPELPLTINGKVDVRALPQPGTGLDSAATDLEQSSPEAAEGPAADDVVEVMTQTWSRLFDQPVSPDADFFELGGNSLLAVRMLARLRDAGVVGLGVRDLYLRPTVRELSLAVTRSPGGSQQLVGANGAGARR